MQRSSISCQYDGSEMSFREGLDTHDSRDNVGENRLTASEDYAYNRELAIREGASDYWRDAMQTSKAKCLNCGRLITEPWWTTLLVPEAVLSRRPLCSSVCLLEYCSNQKWNAGTLEMSLDYPGVFGKLKMRRDTIRLDIPQDQLRAQLDKLHKEQLRPQLEKLHALATRQVTPTLLSEWGFQPWTETVSPERAGRAAKRPPEGVTLTRNTKPKSAASRIRASSVTEATAPKLRFLKAVNAATNRVLTDVETTGRFERRVGSHGWIVLDWPDDLTPELRTKIDEMCSRNAATIKEKGGRDRLFSSHVVFLHNSEMQKNAAPPNEGDELRFKLYTDKQGVGATEIEITEKAKRQRWPRFAHRGRW